MLCCGLNISQSCHVRQACCFSDSEKLMSGFHEIRACINLIQLKRCFCLQDLLRLISSALLASVHSCACIYTCITTQLYLSGSDSWTEAVHWDKGRSPQRSKTVVIGWCEKKPLKFAPCHHYQCSHFLLLVVRCRCQTLIINWIESRQAWTKVDSSSTAEVTVSIKLVDLLDVENKDKLAQSQTGYG